MITAYLGLFIIILYVIIMCLKENKIPKSISETFYLSGKYWFTLVLFVSGILITSGLLVLSEGSDFQFVSFLSGCGMLLVGAAPHYHDTEKTMHIIGASSLLIGSQIWLLIFSELYCFIPWVTVFLWLFKKENLFWCEITVLLTMIFGLIFV